MTGTITGLNTQRRSGSIQAGDGATFTFCDSALTAGNFSLLQIGQEVSFEAGRDREPRNAVSVQSDSPSRSRAAGPAEAWQFIYTGFDQPKDIRHYKFSAVARGKPSRLLTVSVDLALFLKYHVGIQEAPVMCLQKLSHADLEAAQVRHELTDGDLAVYVSDRAAAAARKLQHRMWPKPGKFGSPPRV